MTFDNLLDVLKRKNFSRENPGSADNPDPDPEAEVRENFAGTKNFSIKAVIAAIIILFIIILIYRYG